MVWWWIGNILFLFVVIPVVVILLQRVLRPIGEIHEYAVDVLDHGVKLTGTLDSVPKLAQTRDLAAQARERATRYAGVIERLI